MSQEVLSLHPQLWPSMRIRGWAPGEVQQRFAANNEEIARLQQQLAIASVENEGLVLGW